MVLAMWASYPLYVKVDHVNWLKNIIMFAGSSKEVLILATSTIYIQQIFLEKFLFEFLDAVCKFFPVF